ncbi:chromate resistance protein ChrB domain-containing protein [Litoreibacter arenae]|uniref:Superoxide dismutase n=1 Tax=Litoreibacter arenae DSM 19593 TaxID=1123360 RepID=S9QKC3_9RHOB|nr:sulfurtransferase/chromate resistance protein [Litoreibacter arenae]EPX80227.1 Superoxide dismutase [Litoreibacter arenae DSM 19593]
MAGFSEISPTALMRLIGTPDAPTILDVCIDADFADDPRLIPTARRWPHPEIGGFDGAGPVVVVCQKGLKLSHGAAAFLRAKGIAAEALEGGIYAWRDAGLPLIPAAAIPAPLWVTRHRPKIDRIACPWLIRRFVDPSAQFMFVPPSEVPAVAEKFGATPFDVEGVAFSHVGERCSFDTMLDAFKLDTEPLQTMATVIRAADTNRHDLAPEAAGLLALSVGLSRQYKDDSAQLEAGMALYDALYRWARDGQGEGHLSSVGA